MSGAAPVQRRETNDEEVEFDETEESSSVNGLIYDKVYEVTEKFAGTYVGQYATGKVDRILKLIEDTAKWSLPQNSQEKNSSSTPLERPLPWIPFIAMILMLRMVRISLSVGGLLIGNAPLAPGDVVYFIQTRRRKLRAIRIVGMRDIRRKEQARSQKQSGGIVAKLRSLLSVVVCRPGQGREVPKTSSNNQNSQQESSDTGGNQIDPIDMLNYLLSNDVIVRTQGANPQTTAKGENDITSSKRRRPEEEEDGSDHELTLDQIIDKYGEADSDNDSDFIPPNDALNDDDTSSQSTSSATSDDDDEEDDTPVQSPKEDANTESDTHMTNGNRRSQNSPSNSESQAADNSVLIKENGEHFSKASRKPVPLPKPKKQEPVPAPIQEIKQEPLDSDEDRSNSQQQQQDPAELKRSSQDQSQQHQQQQAVVAQNDEKVYVNDVSKDTSGSADGDVENAEKTKKVNGDENPPVIDPKSGSPNVSGGDFGFQPTSILKNANAVYLEKRAPTVAYTDDDITSRAERTTETHATSRPINTNHQSGKGGSHHTGRHNKNRFRGKRR